VARNDQKDEQQRQFARNLRAARQRAGLTQASLAKQLGMTDEVYSRYERAKMWPSLGKLRDLCRALGCSADVLLDLNESKPRPPRLPPPDDEPPRIRRLLRLLRKARPRTVHLIAKVLLELDKAENDKNRKSGGSGKGERGKGERGTGDGGDGGEGGEGSDGGGEP
jgi:transcriptional regulator with XRE-family HTH domain